MTAHHHQGSASSGQALSFSHAAREHRQILSAPARADLDTHNHNKTERDNHDDGLVHGHFWAMSSTVR